MAMEPVPHRLDARDYLRILTKRKWFIILVASAATIVGGLYTISFPKTYRAAAIILIRRQMPPVNWVGNRDSGGPPMQQDLAIDTQAKIATSTDCATRAAKALGSRTVGDRIQVQPSEIVSSISAFPDKADILRIESTHRQEDKAIAFANEVATAFVAISRELRRSESRAAREFLEETMRTAKSQLDASQAALAAYQEQMGIISPEAETSTVQGELNNYRESLRAAERELAVARTRQQTLEQEQQRIRPYTTEHRETINPQRQVLIQQIQTNQIALSELTARYTDNWPAVREMRRKIEQLRAELARTPETISSVTIESDPRLEGIKGDRMVTERAIAEAQTRVNALRATVAGMEGSSRNLPEKISQLQRLMDRAALAKASYQNVLAQLDNAKLNEAMKQADAEVIDHATRGEETSPKLGRMLVFSLMLGLVCGIALALLLEALDDTIHNPEDLTTYADVKFLGMIPMLEEQGMRLVTLTAPKSPPAEAYRTLRSNVHFAQLDSPARTFLVTSAGAGEGKSSTIANLAIVTAQAGQRVIMVDTDLRRPSQHRLFGVSATQGLTNVLVGEASIAEVLQDTEVPGLRIMTTGPLPPNPAELLNSERMDAVIAEVRDMADVVFFDSPPTIILTDSVILSSKIERTILVAEAGQVTRDAFNEMCRLILNARGNILGAVLNKLRISASDYYYYYYYYDYTHYGSRREAPKVAAGAAPPAGTDLGAIFGDDQAVPPPPPEVAPPPAPVLPPAPAAAPPAPRPAWLDEAPLSAAPPATEKPAEPKPPSPLEDLFGNNDEEK
jgi:polysaccharide biosynthesis transport protein